MYIASLHIIHTRALAELYVCIYNIVHKSDKRHARFPSSRETDDVSTYIISRFPAGSDFLLANTSRLLSRRYFPQQAGLLNIARGKNLIISNGTLAMIDTHNMHLIEDFVCLFIFSN